MTATTASETWLDGAAGRLFARHWEPAAAPKANLVLCHGVNAHSGHEIRAGEAFAAAGYAVTALDLRGRGRSDGRRFTIDHIDEYVADVAVAIDHAKSLRPGLPTFLLGHSAGGVTSVTYALDHQAEIAGLVCESFAFRVFAPDFALKLLEGASHVVPHLPALKLPMEAFSRDPEWVAQLKADPLTHDETQPVDTVAAFARAGERFEREFPRITLPVLILHGSDDHATRPDGSQEFYDNAGSADKTLKIYDGYFHDLLNDIGRDQVIADIVGWLDARVAQPATA